MATMGVLEPEVYFGHWPPNIGFVDCLHPFKVRKALWKMGQVFFQIEGRIQLPALYAFGVFFGGGVDWRDLNVILGLNVAGLAQDQHRPFGEASSREITIWIGIPFYFATIRVEHLDFAAQITVLQCFFKSSSAPRPQQLPSAVLGHHEKGNVNEDFALVEQMRL